MSHPIFIVAHEPLASALKACAMHVYPECAKEVVALDVPANEDPADTLARAKLMDVGEEQQEVLILTDILGATPANIARQWALGRRATVIAGVNVPMLFRCVCYRHESMDALVQKALIGGAMGVMQVDTQTL